jgi:hypothetical protein
MRRRLFNILAAASLVLCVAVGVLWVRTHDRTLIIGHLDERRKISSSLVFSNGHFTFHQMRILAGTTLRYTGDVGLSIELDHPFYVRGSWRGGAGVYWVVDKDSSETLTAATVRLAWLFAGFVMPWLWVLVAAGLHLKQFARRKQGLCLTCGYNLTRNVSGVCPECGHACT